MALATSTRILEFEPATDGGAGNLEVDGMDGVTETHWREWSRRGEAEEREDRASEKPSERTSGGGRRTWIYRIGRGGGRGRGTEKKDESVRAPHARLP